MMHIHDWNRGGHSILEDAERTEAVEVVALPLDEYLKGRESEIGLIKIDVEGAEGLVLAGMHETLRRRLPRTIIVEFNPAAVRRIGMDPVEVLRASWAQGIASGRSMSGPADRPRWTKPRHATCRGRWRRGALGLISYSSGEAGPSIRGSGHRELPTASPAGTTP